MRLRSETPHLQAIEVADGRQFRADATARERDDEYRHDELSQRSPSGVHRH
jgi:hypothetical protein